ncbi:MAG: hypothetical protein AAFV43_04285 [Planctomycetota bacterium]
MVGVCWASIAVGFDVSQAAEGVSYGPRPESPADWRALAERGVRTVLGVDGLPPDLELAEQHGLGVFHVPLGYDGVDREDQLALTAAARGAARPLYVFCHHGKHRGPAAAAIVCRAVGLLDATAATELLREAGTSPDYPGLWRDVASFTPPPDDAPLPSLVTASETSPLALAMTQLDRGLDAYRKATDVEMREASLVTIREALRESRRAALTANAAVDLLSQLDTATAMAKALSDAPSPDRSIEIQLGQSCVACHATHRDN